MEENKHFFVPENHPANEADKSISKKHLLKFALIFLGIIIVILAAYYIYESYFSSSARMERQYSDYQKWEEGYVQAQKNDTYGGKTPEETLAMFIDALKKGDIELASKYFVLEENGVQDPKWLEGLQQQKDGGKLDEIAGLLEKAKPAGSVMGGYYGFEIRNNQGELTNDISLILNKYSNLWKIGSL